MEPTSRPVEKDLRYAESIENFKKILQKHEMRVEVVSWLNPLENVWSVHIHDRECPRLYTNGKGVSREGALASAYGEFFERLTTGYFFADYSFQGIDSTSAWEFSPRERWFPAPSDTIPMGVLTPSLRAFYGAGGLLESWSLLDSNVLPRGRGICALPFTSSSDKALVWFPVNILDNLYVSNGMAAGNSMAEARVQALSEILERHVKNQVIGDCLTLPDIPADHLASLTTVTCGITELEAQGFTVLVKDASLGGRFPVVNITLIHQATGGVFAAFGAHPRFSVAMERTLTELMQGRSLETLGDFRLPIFDERLAADRGNLEEHFIDSAGLLHWNFFLSDSDFPFTAWDFTGDRAGEVASLEGLIRELGFEIFSAEYTWAGVDVCRIIIPGMSEIYPVEDLVDNNKNSTARLRDALFDLPASDTEQKQWLYEELCDMGYPQGAGVGEIMGIPADDSLLVAELLFLLALHLEREEEAAMWCEAAQSELDAHPDRRKFYACMEFTLRASRESGYTPEAIAQLSRRFFGATTTNTCERLSRGEEDPLDLVIARINALLDSDSYLAVMRMIQKCRAIQGTATYNEAP